MAANSARNALMHRALGNAVSNLLAHRVNAARCHRLVILEDQAQRLDGIGNTVIEAVGGVRAPRETAPRRR